MSYGKPEACAAQRAKPVFAHDPCRAWTLFRRIGGRSVHHPRFVSCPTSIPWRRGSGSEPALRRASCRQPVLRVLAQTLGDQDAGELQHPLEGFAHLGWLRPGGVAVAWLWLRRQLEVHRIGLTFAPAQQEGAICANIGKERADGPV